ncbi:hypothetical protein Q3G72_005761 [Acer saccharum]|nr:hypothetical protein Q3G72_005761 [Acer saccharum]
MPVEVVEYATISSITSLSLFPLKLPPILCDTQTLNEQRYIARTLLLYSRIVLLGNDGIECPFLCKPKDDLRKDARMMEFTAMINRLLSKNPESRRRKLYIRTFAVISLTEDCVLENELVFRLLAASFCHFDQLLCTDHVECCFGSLSLSLLCQI